MPLRKCFNTLILITDYQFRGMKNRAYLGNKGLSKQNLNFITVIVKNLETAREAVTLNGGVLLETPVELRKGMRISFAADPEGNLRACFKSI